MVDIRAVILWRCVKTRLFVDRPKIIAITGSIAKTSTKDATYEMMRHALPGKVRATYGNLNSYLGVPLGILGFKFDFYEKRITWQWGWILIVAFLKMFFQRLPKYLIVELGVDKPGDMDKFLKQFKPYIGVITLIDRAHLMNFPEEHDYAKEKIRLVSKIQPNGFAVINANDKYRDEIKDMAKVETIFVDTVPENISEDFAKKIGKVIGLSDEQIQSGLSGWQRPPHRFNKLVINDLTVYDDTYNASPASMMAALSVLASEKGHRVAILGEMKELGDKEEQLHKEIGQVAHSSADLIIGVGELSKLYNPNEYYENSNSASDTIFNHIKNNDIILVKGSHSLHMDKIVEKLKERNNDGSV